jgi:signal transduction histidine kinase
MDASRKMSNLIDALLHFSRVGTISLNKVLLDPSYLITEIIDDKRIQYPNILIETNIDVQHKIWADKILIYQVFENLISNAIKYSSKQTKIELRIVSKLDNSDVVFSISDNGIGFNLAFAKKLFLPFQRLHGSEEFEGTGIGLANVRRIIERHSGNISAVSEPHRGATFTFSLPNINIDI